MSTPPVPRVGGDVVRLHAVFVPDGETAPPELLAGMTDIVRLNVRLPMGGGDVTASSSVEDQKSG